MRTDPELGIRLSGDSTLDSQQLTELYGQSSLSGHERNHVFLSRSGERFLDLSGLSGLNHIGDSRAFALLDFDRDGWLDIAMVNANAPFFQLFHNRIPGLSVEPTHSLAVRLVGGNHSSTASPGLSNRDGIGAVVTADFGDLQLRREQRAGEGFAAQNQAALLIGLGSRQEARSVAVHWPSGRQLDTGPLPAGSIVTLYEDPAHSPTTEAFTVEAYTVAHTVESYAGKTSAGEAYRADPLLDGTPGSSAGRPLAVAKRLAGKSKARLLMLTTVATWCEACHREIPQLRHLQDNIASSDLAMFGVPVDPEDSQEKLEDYVATRTPPYRLLADLAPEDAAEVRTRVLEVFHHEALPTTFITDREGNVVYAEAGVPTISDLRRLLGRPEP